MEKLFNTYVDSDFLQAFLSKKTGFDIEESGEELNIWRSLLRFYRKNTKICLQLKSISFKELAYNFDSSLVKEMLNKYSQGSDEIKICENLEELKQSKYDSFLDLNFIFCGDESILIQKANSCGIPHISNENLIDEWAKYYNTRTIKIPKKKEPNIKNIGWVSLDLPIHKCNSVIICDNYLLSYRNNLENNFFPILELLMPMNDLDIPFDLTIFSSIFYDCPKYEVPDKKLLEKISKEILRFLNIELNLQNVNLTIIHKELREYHDRHIFTNGFAFSSGNSFTYFGPNGTPILPSETTLDVQPLTAENKNNCYAELYASDLRELNEIMLNSSIYYGSKKNRLFSNVGNL